MSGGGLSPKAERVSKFIEVVCAIIVALVALLAWFDISPYSIGSAISSGIGSLSTTELSVIETAIKASLYAIVGTAAFLILRRLWALFTAFLIAEAVREISDKA